MIQAPIYPDSPFWRCKGCGISVAVNSDNEAETKAKGALCSSCEYSERMKLGLAAKE